MNKPRVPATIERPREMARPSSALIGMMTILAACSTTPIRSGPIIDHYAHATCVSAHSAGPHTTRNWDQVIACPGGSAAHLVGVVASTGHVWVEYPHDDVRYVVSAFGEKSNPLDVRFDAGSCRLYVWSTGSPIFTQRPLTRLVEYDLRSRREVQSVTLDAQVVLPPCSDQPDAG